MSAEIGASIGSIGSSIGSAAEGMGSIGMTGISSGAEFSGGFAIPSATLSTPVGISSEKGSMPFDTPSQSDLSFLNPALDLGTSDLAVVDEYAPTLQSESDSFISGLLADLDASDPYVRDASLDLEPYEATNTSIDSSNDTAIDSFSLAEITDSPLAVSEPALAQEAKTVDVATEEVLALENEAEMLLSAVDSSQTEAVTAEQTQIDAIIAELNDLSGITSAEGSDTTAAESDKAASMADTTTVDVISTTNETTENVAITKTNELANTKDFTMAEIASSNQAGETIAVSINDTEQEKPTTLLTNTTQVTEANTVKNDQANAVPSTADAEAISSHPNNSSTPEQEVGDVAQAIKATDISDYELKKGARILKELTDIEIPEEEATTTVAEILKSDTDVNETIGEEGEEQVVIEKVGQEVKTESKAPVVDQEINDKRKDIALDTVTKKIEEIEQHLDQKGITVKQGDIWISGKYIAEELTQKEILSGILEEGPDGSNAKLVVDLTSEWVNLANADSKIEEAIRNNNAVKIATAGESASDKEVEKALSKKNAGIIYGPNIK